MSNVRIEFERINDEAFIKVNKVRDIVRVYVCSRKDDGYYRAAELCGSVVEMSTEKLEQNYTMCDGSRIRKLYLKSGSTYDVVGIDREFSKEYAAMLVPDNCEVLIGKRIVQGGSYIVLDVDVNGCIDRDKVYTIGKDIFRKAFKIPMNNMIFRCSGKPVNREIRRKRSNQTVEDNRVKYEVVDKKANNTVEQNTSNQRIGETYNIRNVRANNISYNKPVDNNNNKKDVKKYKYRAISRVVDINGSLYAFEIMHIGGTRIDVVSKHDMLSLCENKLVENIMCTNKDGKKFLKGNGIKIADLPEKEI